MKNLINKFETFVFKNGYTHSTVWDDWLMFIIYAFTANGKALDNWIYSKEDNAVFQELMFDWFKLMHKEINDNKSWYDALGIMYEQIILLKSKASNIGQFFTPIHICNLMVELYSFKGTGQRISDPCCGSGRFLIAFHAKNPGNFLFAEDIDRTACLMTVCNFLVHGGVGEVIWHNSLDPNSFFDGWVVNRNLNNPASKYFGIPHVEKLKQEDSFCYSSYKEKIKTINVQEEIQLSLFQ